MEYSLFLQIISTFICSVVIQHMITRQRGETNTVNILLKQMLPRCEEVNQNKEECLKYRSMLAHQQDLCFESRA